MGWNNTMGNDNDSVETFTETGESLLDPKGRLLVPPQEAGRMLNLGRNSIYLTAPLFSRK